MKAIHLINACLLSALVVPMVFAQGYPTKAVRVIAPSAPGSPPDVVARIVAERLTVALGQPVFVENRAGASGSIGLAVVASAAADGHTLGMMAMPYTVVPSLLSSVPYDTVRDLTGLSQLVWSTNMLVVRADSPWRSVRELISGAKASPGRLTSASGGNTTPARLALELFKLHDAVDIQHIPFKGTVAGVTAVLGGQVDLMFATTGVVSSQVRAGKLRALAVVSPARLTAYAEVPTMAELGYSAVDVRDWSGIIAPSATPRDVIGVLAREISRALSHSTVADRLTAAMYEPTPESSPKAFDKLIQSELARWSKVVRQIGIQAD